MALLLAMYQKMRLIREKNQLVLDQTKVSSKLSRVQKNIERTQKRYTSLFAQLDSQAKLMQSNATVYFQNMFGLGQNSVNPYSYSGLNQNMLNNVGGALAQGGYKFQAQNHDNTYTGYTPGTTEQNGNTIYYYELDAMGQAGAQAMLEYYMSHNCSFAPKYKDGSTSEVETNANGEKLFGDAGQWTEKQVEAFQAAMSSARMMQQQQQMACQQMQTGYQNNVSIWLDAQKAALEAEQDAMLEPLNYEETMLELEKEQKDTRLQRINEEIETYKQLVSQEVKNTTPTFGLG